MKEEELEKARKKKLEELKKKKKEEQEEKEKQVKQAKAQIKNAIRKVLSQKAWEKWNNVRVANEDNALAAAQVILQSVKAGKLQPNVSEEKLKQILKRVNSMTSQDFNIRRR